MLYIKKNKTKRCQQIGRKYQKSNYGNVNRRVKSKNLFDSVVVKATSDKSN